MFAGYNYFGRAKDGDNICRETTRLVQNLHMFDHLRADRCFAASGLEVRVPFLDHDPLKYALSLPGDLRGFRGVVEKALLRDAFRDVEVLQHARIIDRQRKGCLMAEV